MRFQVTNKKVVVVDRTAKLVGDNEYEFEFEFDEEWKDKVKTARFVLGDNRQDKILDEKGKCVIDKNFFKSGKLKIGVYASKIATEIAKQNVRPSILDEDGSDPPVPGEVWTQLLEIINEDVQFIHESVDDTTKYFDGLKGTLDTMTKEVSSLKTDAENSVLGVKEAIIATKSATKDALSAKDAADEATTNANDAASKTTQAIEKAEAAAQSVRQAITDAETATSNANKATAETRTAKEETLDAKSLAEKATTDANNAANEAKAATRETLTAKERAEETITNTLDAKTKTEQATADVLEVKTLTEAATTEANKATLAANKATVDVNNAIDGAQTAAENANKAASDAITAKEKTDTATSNATRATEAAEIATNKANDARESAYISASRADRAAIDAQNVANAIQEKLDRGELKGEKGGQGIQGIQGEKGEKGEKGDTGPQGPAGTGTGDMLASVYDPNGKMLPLATENDVDAHTSDSVVHITSEERAKWNTKAEETTVLLETLTAGATSLSLKSDKVTTKSVIDIYASVYGIVPVAVSVLTGEIQLTFENQPADVDVRVEVR